MLRLKQTFEAHLGYCFSRPQRSGGRAEESGGAAAAAEPRGALGDAAAFLLTNGEEACQHDFHHTHNSGCFGAEWLDWLFGTMDGYAALGGDHAGYCAKMRRDADDAAAKKQ